MQIKVIDLKAKRMRVGGGGTSSSSSSSSDSGGGGDVSDVGGDGSGGQGSDALASMDLSGDEAELESTLALYPLPSSETCFFNVAPSPLSPATCDPILPSRCSHTVLVPRPFFLPSR